MGNVCASSRDDAKAESPEKDLALRPPDTPSHHETNAVKRRWTVAKSAVLNHDHKLHSPHPSPHPNHGKDDNVKDHDKEHHAHDHKTGTAQNPEKQPVIAEPWNWEDHLPMPWPALVSMMLGAVGGHALSWHVFIILFFVVCAVTPVVYNFCMAAIGKSLKGVIEKVDRKVLGVDVHLGKIDVSICQGRFVISDLVIDNPEPFKAEYLLKAAKVTIDIDVQELILSRGMHIVVEELELDEVDAIVEYNSTFGMSGKNNFDTVVDFMGHLKPSESSKAGKLLRRMSHMQDEIAKKQKVSLIKVAFIDVGAKVTNQMIGTRIACSDIRYKNFEKEVGTNALDDVMYCLVNSIAKSILVNIGGKAFAGSHGNHTTK